MVRELLKPASEPMDVSPAEERDLNELIDLRFEKVLDYIDNNIQNKLIIRTVQNRKFQHIASL